MQAAGKNWQSETCAAGRPYSFSCARQPNPTYVTAPMGGGGATTRAQLRVLNWRASELPDPLKACRLFLVMKPKSERHRLRPDAGTCTCQLILVAQQIQPKGGQDNQTSDPVADCRVEGPDYATGRVVIYGICSGQCADANNFILSTDCTLSSCRVTPSSYL